VNGKTFLWCLGSVLAFAFGCAHPPDPGTDDQLWLVRAHCDRDQGQWVIEYDKFGSVVRYACVKPRGE
jgi:hypothetical protein